MPVLRDRRWRASAHHPPRPHAHQALPARVAISVVNATIGPSKANGAKWDGKGQVSPSVVKSVIGLVASKLTPYAAVVSLLAAPELPGHEAPDPYGSADVAVGGEYRAKMHHVFFDAFPVLAKGKRAKKSRITWAPDTYTPIFPDFEWHDVPLNDGTRIKVTLYSHGSFFHAPQPIGVAEINYRDLVAAWRAEKIDQVKMADQTQNQLLFVGISVRGEGGDK